MGLDENTTQLRAAGTHQTIQRQVPDIAVRPLVHLNFCTQLLPTKLAPTAQMETHDAFSEE